MFDGFVLQQEPAPTHVAVHLSAEGQKKPNSIPTKQYGINDTANGYIFFEKNNLIQHYMAYFDEMTTVFYNGNYLKATVC